jgi:hypothetical protein
VIVIPIIILITAQLEDFVPESLHIVLITRLTSSPPLLQLDEARSELIEV